MKLSIVIDENINSIVRKTMQKILLIDSLCSTLEDNNVLQFRLLGFMGSISTYTLALPVCFL